MIRPFRTNDSSTRMLISLMVATLLASILVLIMPRQAEAACTGTTSWWSATAWGKEDSRWVTTCDGLNDYYGRVQDILSDGHRVRIKALPNGNTFYSALSSDAWKNYDYNDSDSWTQFRLERVRVSDSALTAWGTWGVNRGF